MRAERRLRALFRARLSWLRADLSPRERLLLRLLPALIHARIPTHGFDGDPLGLLGARAQLSWTRAARGLELPLPDAVARQTQLVESLWVLHTVGGLEVLVIPVGARDEDRGRIQPRLASITRRLTDLGFRVQLQAVNTSVLAADATLQHRLWHFGALVHGPLPPIWLQGRLKPPSLPERLRLAEVAPNALLSTGLLLSAPCDLDAPLTTWKEALEEGVDARTLAHPALGLALWLGRGHPDASSLIKAVAWDPRSNSGASRARKLIGVEHALPEATSLREEGQRLTRAVLEARHQVPPDERPHAHQLAIQELLPQGFPRSLLPALTRMLSGHASHWVEQESGTSVELRDSSGLVLARERTAEQAWARAVLLTRAALGKSPFHGDVQGVWKAVADVEHVRRPGVTRMIGILARPMEGAPSDPLNRGDQREIGFESGVVVTLRGNRRPTGRLMGAGDIVALVCSAPSSKERVELLAESAESQPVVARLRRLETFADAAWREGLPWVAEAGGRIFLRHHGRVRHPALGRFALRPTRARMDPEAPDFAMLPGSSERSIPGAGELWAFVSLAAEGFAHVLYSDAKGYRLRERIPLADVEAHLEEAQGLLRQGHDPSRLLIRADQTVELAIRRHAGSGLPPTLLELHGDLPFHFALKLGDELFGSRGGPGWDAAAQSVLSKWPVRIRGRIGVSRASVWAGGAPVSGLMVLYVRSMALRRLWAHVTRAERA